MKEIHRIGKAKSDALDGNGKSPIHPINKPLLDPEKLMPRLKSNGLRSLSLFSGGGGLDLGFDLAGFEHAASYELIENMGETLKKTDRSGTFIRGIKATLSL